MQFPAGFNASGATAPTINSGLTGSLYIVSATTSEVIVGRSGGASFNGPVSFSIGTIQNPATAGTTGSYTVETQNATGGLIDSGTAPGDTITGGGGGSLTGVDVQPASLVAGATGTVDVNFTTTNLVPSNGGFEVVFPAGFNLAPVSSVTILSGPSGTLGAPSVSGQTVSVQRTGGGTSYNGMVSLRITNVTNPSATGMTGSYTVRTLDGVGVLIDSGTAPGDTITSGAGALNVIEGTVNLQDVEPGKTSAFCGVTIQNTTASTFTTVRREIATPLTFGVNTIPVGNIVFSPSEPLTVAVNGSTEWQVQVSVPAGQPTGLYATSVTIYNDANANGVRDGGELFDSFSLQVNVTTTQQQAPTFGGLKLARATSVAGEVYLEWDAAVDPQGNPITYRIFESTTPAGPFTLFTTTPAPASSILLVGLSAVEHFFRVQAQDSFGNELVNTVTKSAEPAATVNHIHMVASGTGSVNQPVLVRLEAHDVSHAPVSSFNGSLQINVAESGGTVNNNSVVLSTTDRVTGVRNNVEMAGGRGLFTVTTDEIEDLTISINGIAVDPSGGLLISFKGAMGGAFSQYVISAKSYGANTGIPILVSAVDASGKVIDGYAGTVTLNVTGNTAAITWAVINGAGTLSGNAYTFAPGDHGEVLLSLGGANSGDVLNISASGAASNTETVTAKSVTQYLVESRGQRVLAAGVTTTGGRITFDVFAADSSGNRLSGYSGSATVTITGESLGSPGSSARATPASLSFSNGVATFELEDSEYESVQFKVENPGPPLISSGLLDAIFRSSDAHPPEVLRAVAENPYEVRIFFSEELDQVNTVVLSNWAYNGAVPHTVCWYGDQVTLHMTTAVFNQAATVSIQGTSGDDIKDKSGNYIGNNPVVSVQDVPRQDYLGGGTNDKDFFEIQIAGTHVVVYHKNSCGYLSGANAANQKVALGSGPATVSYTGTLTGPASINFNDGVAEFDVTGTGTFTVSYTGILSGNGSI